MHSLLYQILLEKIAEEARTYGDVIQEDFVDSYMNLTLKSVMGLRWAHHHCPELDFFMKTDDDVFVNVPHLLGYLEQLVAIQPEFITG